MGRKPRASDALERVLGGELYAKLQSCKVREIERGISACVCARARYSCVCVYVYVYVYVCVCVCVCVCV